MQAPPGSGEEAEVPTARASEESSTAGVHFVCSATVEERYLTGQFPEPYPADKHSTKMLLPFIF